MSGLLIVNADDFGAAPATTDAILACFDAGAVTSTTAMLWMADSERAAGLARERGLPVGLHVNLTMEFDGDGVPPPTAERQAKLVRKLGGRLGLMRWLYRPLLQREVAVAVGEQLARFEELYGRAPTHVDGHNHVHVSPNVLRALPPGIRVRTTHDFAGSLGDSPKVIRRALIRRRFRTTDSFFSIRSIHPELGGAGLDEVLELARSRTVEVMVHPHWDDELAVLTAPRWRERIAGLPLGSYADLA